MVVQKSGRFLKISAGSIPRVSYFNFAYKYKNCLDFTTRPQSEPIGPPRHAKAKRLSKKEKHLKNDWLMRRGARRAEQRKRSTESAWFFERQAQRTALRHSDQSSDWLFDRGSQRAMLRQH